MKSRFLLGFIMIFGIALDVRPQSENRTDLARITGVIADRYTREGLQATITYTMLPYWEQTGVLYSADSTGAFVLYLAKERTYQLEIISEQHFPFPAQFWIDGDQKRDFLLTPLPKEVFRLEHLIFDERKAIILPDSYAELNDLVITMYERPQIVIQLEGHTDILGNSEANLRLSENRVAAVKRYLTKKGIKANRIQTKAYGDTRPLTHDRSEEGKRLNRRVEVRILNETED